MSDLIKVTIYSCEKHPTWTLETTSPIMKAGLKVFCPICRDEFMERNIGLAFRRTEERERRPSEVQPTPTNSEPSLF